MPVNWGLGIAPDIGKTFMDAFQQGRQQNALAKYATDPNDQNLNALAPYKPEFVVAQREKLHLQDVRRRAAQGDPQARQELAGVDMDAFTALDKAAHDKVAERAQLIGEAAQWADTPQKWDAAIDHLVQMGHADLAQFKGQFSPENRMAAIAGAGQLKDYYERNKPINMSPGGQLVSPTGEVIHAAPFAPWHATVGEGQTVIESTPGGQGGAAGSVSPDDLFGRMIHQESRGNQFSANGQPLQSSAGALGIAQVMPGTAPEAAALAGVPFDENRYRTDPEYNAALGKAYFQKQLQTFQDPMKAVAAYNAGPGRVQDAVAKHGDQWLAHMPAETRDYVAKVMPGASTGAGTRVVAQGPPKQPEWHRMTPDEVRAEGLPEGSYLRNVNGDIKPVAGTKPSSQSKPIPASTEQKLSDQFGIYTALQQAADSFDSSYFGNPLGGMENAMQRYLPGSPGTPGQAEWWAAFRSTDNLIRNQMFGSALTAQEKKAYEETTVSPAMNAKTAAQRILKRRDIIQGALRRRARVLAAQGYNQEAIGEMFGNEPSIIDGLPTPGGATAPTSSGGWGKMTVSP